MQKIGVIGSGTMGGGIAQILALRGYQVIMFDIKDDVIQKSRGRIEKQLQKNVDRERLTPEDKDRTLALISTTTSMIDLQEVDLIIEAAIEDLEIKKNIFNELEGICDKEVIFATNTSSLSITELAGSTGRPEKVVGMHFFNPVPVMKLVEVVKGEKTSPATVNMIKELAKKLDKRPIEVQDSPGFVVNRLLIPMINEAAFLYGEQVASAEAIDKGMELGANHPIGPLALADLIGLDVCLAIMKSLHESLGQDKYRPAPVLQEKVEKGELGRKSKQGFYSYS